jgi:hypothetical protein
MLQMLQMLQMLLLPLLLLLLPRRSTSDGVHCRYIHLPYLRDIILSGVGVEGHCVSTRVRR